MILDAKSARYYCTFSCYKAAGLSFFAETSSLFYLVFTHKRPAVLLHDFRDLYGQSLSSSNGKYCVEVSQHLRAFCHTKYQGIHGPSAYIVAPKPSCTMNSTESRSYM